MSMTSTKTAFKLGGLFLAVVLATSCSSRVDPSAVAGSYKADYPFGQSTLLLRRDGTFTQQVVIAGQPPASTSGTWSFDGTESTLALRGAMGVTDGFGHLSRDWRTASDSPAVPVERLWGKVAIEDSSEYPHVRIK